MVDFCAKTLWTLDGRVAQAELSKRGISPEIARLCKVGYNPQWIEIPEYETHLAQGIVLPVWVGEKLWSVNVRTPRTPKYHRPKGGSRCPYGIWLLSGKPILIVCEGELDALTALSFVADVADVVALRGTNNTIQDWVHYFQGYERIILCLDGDDAGREAAQGLRFLFPLWEGRRPPRSANDVGKIYEAGYDVRSFLLHGFRL